MRTTTQMLHYLKFPPATPRQLPPGTYLAQPNLLAAGASLLVLICPACYKR